MSIERSVVAVPARLQSSRLPNKVLADIGGKPMIQRVLERCREAQGPCVVVLCTDSLKLQELAQTWGFPVLITAESCSSGSERIASVADALVALDFFVAHCLHFVCCVGSREIPVANHGHQKWCFHNGILAWLPSNHRCCVPTLDWWLVSGSWLANGSSQLMCAPQWHHKWLLIFTYPKALTGG